MIKTASTFTHVFCVLTQMRLVNLKQYLQKLKNYPSEVIKRQHLLHQRELSKNELKRFHSAKMSLH